jgi:hypothetical protein
LERPGLETGPFSRSALPGASGQDRAKAIPMAFGSGRPRKAAVWASKRDWDNSLETLTFLTVLTTLISQNKLIVDPNPGRGQHRD